MKKLRNILLFITIGLALVACGKETKTGITVGLNTDTDEIADETEAMETYSEEGETSEIEIESTEQIIVTSPFEDEEETNNMVGFWMTDDNTTIVEFKSDNSYSRYNISQNEYYYGTYDTDGETFITLTTNNEENEESTLTYYLSITTQTNNDETFKVATISRGETTIVLIEKDIEN
jgi:hypothetical protein